jgi:hypothetical protein
MSNPWYTRDLTLEVERVNFPIRMGYSRRPNLIGIRYPREPSFFDLVTKDIYSVLIRGLRGLLYRKVYV